MEPEVLTDPRCVATAGTLVLDGANGVCREARLGSRDESGWRAAGLVVAIAIAASLAARARGRVALVVIALAAMVPGAVAVLAARADRPAEIGRSAETIARLHDAVHGFASERCAEITVDRCLACEPIARLALSGRRCAGGAPIELHEDALERGCVARAGALVCGGP